MRDTPFPFADRSPTAVPAIPACEARGAVRPEASTAPGPGACAGDASAATAPSSQRLRHLFRHMLKHGQVNPLLHILNHDRREEAP
ncbi:hypothetical protein [Methylibium sp.]|uniref:hypothetical protein n=1 Tax=Methylibium sp. TaxID=2067992 RepID=UPI003D10F67A